MLQKEAVVPKMISLIKELQSDPLFKNHILTGGTALALHLGHRTSTDIDLFTLKEQSAMAFAHYLRNNYKDVTIEISKDDFTRAIINGIKVELVQYNEKYIEEPKIVDGITLASINDIAAMKLDAMFKRSEARDFIDIAFLLLEMPLNQMFDLYEKKMGSISRVYMKRTLLTKCRAIKDKEWLKGGIIMLRYDIIPTDIPKLIEQKIKENNQIITDKIAASNIKKKNENNT
ncbi:MAG: nucleotidyl transferase AbiEii/AbiGii toxin family protein [Treponema sp.]|jgi:predicted nucleotidyltransferase component of viral defense system|nr:nucleotidyl transferase AbiEii/AbiGii toxin family protein [Treponema sp.]